MDNTSLSWIRFYHCQNLATIMFESLHTLQMIIVSLCSKHYNKVTSKDLELCLMNCLSCCH